MDVAYDEEEGEDAQSGDAADEDHGTYEGACGLDDDADDDGRDDAGQVAHEVEDAAGEADRIGWRNVTDGAPDDSCHSLAEESDGHDGDDGIDGIGIIGCHDSHGAEKAADDGEFAGL